MKYLSLFTGIGGFELGIQQAYELRQLGIKPKDSTDIEGGTPQYTERPLCIGYSEIDKYAIQIYEKHFGCVTHTQQQEKGIRIKEGQSSECTDQCTNRFNSSPHKNYGDITTINPDTLPDFDLLVGGFPCQSFSIAGKRKGFNDTRGTLFFDIARILRTKQPRLFLLENVKGLLSHDNGKTFSTIISTLTELGYDLQWQVLNSKNHGVPQNRERIFIVGHTRGTPRPQVFPIGLPEKQNLQQHKLRPNKKNKQKTWYQSNDTNSIWRTSYSDGMRIRRLTPTECERLQGFPDGWTEGVSDTQRYKTLGNAVTVNVIKYIIERLKASR